MTSSPDPVDVRRRAGWLAQSQDDLESWLAGHRQRVEARGEDLVLDPVLVEFRELVDTDAVLRMHLNEMISQVPRTKQYRKRHLDSVEELLRLINEVLTMAPEFGDQKRYVAARCHLGLDYGDIGRFRRYRDPRINGMLRKVLTVWSTFLSSSASLYVLNDSPSGWKCEAARQAVGIEQYHYDPQDERWGFRSWNDFFTRRFKHGARPVHSPDDDDVIVSACESTPYAIAADVRLQDSFWIKSQPYSLRDMLANHDASQQFVGGTVYQAFLSATNYHRWHSPVAGTIVEAFVQPGTYYSEADSEGAESVDPVDSQGYLAHVATRAIVLIEADNPIIGLLGFVAVGMSEVSSCLIGPDITAGHHVAKGEELGYFQFGGSTHCLIFRPGAIADFHMSAIPQLQESSARLVRVCSKIAVAASGK